MKYIYTIILLNISLFINSQTKAIDYKSLKGEKSKIKISKKYTFSKIYDYRINSKNLDSLLVKPFNNNLPENILTSKFENQLLQNKPDSISFSLRLFSKLSVDIKRTRYVFIKYQQANNMLSTNEILILKRNEDNWQEINNKSPEIQFFETIMKNSSVNVLFQFYNKKDSKRYPEVNKLKFQTKDIKGNLDIEKLAKTLEKNRDVLSKYIKK